MTNLTLSWFDNEELTYSQWQELFKDYREAKPNVVVSHDCPAFVVNILLMKKFKKQIIFDKKRSLTQTGLEACYNIHQPSIWLFGHHHKSFDEIIGRTRFKCLRELTTYKL